MTAYFAQGRLGTELSLLPIWFFETLIDYSPDGDPWLKGETLIFMVKRMAFETNRDFHTVMTEVKARLTAKHEKAVKWEKPIKTEAAIVHHTMEHGGFGGSFLCNTMEHNFCTNDN
jgi:hypothetical protein